LSRGREDEPGFASRWSRLKQEAKAEPVEAEAEPAAPEPEAPVDDDRPDEEVLEELGLPDPDTLKPGDNFAAFMARAVPARLRNRALRKLWISDPVLANLDELLDYGEDFTDAATVVENLQTAYQVGKGFVDKVTELSGEDAGSAEEGAEEPPEEPAGEPPEEAPEEPAEASDETGADDGDSVDLAEEIVPEDTGDNAVPEERIRVRQRMRFRLAEDPPS
jgi:hypothetical protein